MTVLLTVLIALVIIVVLVAMSNDDFEEETCSKDIPCAECGLCFTDHPTAFQSHSYTRRQGNYDS